MCGIIGYAGTKNAVPVLLNGLGKLEYRGYDSAGIAVMDRDKISVRKSSGKLKNLAEKIKQDTGIQGNIGIGHTRWATHGKPSETNAHPHTSFNGNFTVVHNGIIENYIELREELTDKGFIFRTDTDTEVIPQLLSYYYEGNLLDCVSKALKRLDGSYGLAILCSEYPDTIVCARRSSPIILAKGENENFVASDICAVLEYTNQAVSLEDNEIAVLTRESIEFYDENLLPEDKTFSVVDMDITSVQKNGYEHFMLKEIYEQPEKVSALFEDRIKEGAILMNELSAVSYDLKSAEKLYIIGCGSAYHAGIAGKYLIEEMCGVSVETDVASEFRYRNPVVSSKTPVILISQSGETADTIAALRLAKKKGAVTIGIVNVPGSTIAAECDSVLYTNAGREIAVATTKGYTTQLAMLYLFALYLLGLKHEIAREDLAAYCQTLKSVPEKMERILDDVVPIREKADLYFNKRNIYFIGRNLDYALALEGSLKLKEISYINCEAYGAGELKHGTIALIEKGSLVVALCCNKRLLPKTLSNIKEVTARGAEVLCVTAKGNESLFDDKTEFILCEQTDDLFMPLLEVIPLQLLAYFIAKNKDCDIDMPKNLAKSVTVE